MLTEEEHYLMILRLLLEVATPILAAFLDIWLTKRNQNLESFININKHSLYHLHFNTDGCCKCSSRITTVPRRTLSIAQLELILDCSSPILTGHDEFCCANAKPGITTKDLDISFINSLLLNFFPEAFWDFLPTHFNIKHFESFLNTNNHNIFHMYEHKNCCKCTNAKNTTKTKLGKKTLKKLYNLNGSPCRVCSTVTSVHSIWSCSMVAKQNVSSNNLTPYEISVFQQWFSITRNAMTSIVDIRNGEIAHRTTNRITEANFIDIKDKLVKAILTVSGACGTQHDTEILIQQTMKKKFDHQLLQEYTILMMDTYSRETNTEKLIADMKDFLVENSKRQDSRIKIVEVKTAFGFMYVKSPKLFIQDKVFTLSKPQIMKLCEVKAIFHIIPALYQSSFVFVSQLGAHWIRISEKKEKNIQFRLKKGGVCRTGKQFFHIESVDFPKHYLTMGFLGWWLRAKLYEDQITDDDASWDIRCLETDDGHGNTLSKYLLVPKNSDEFVCIDRTNRLKGKCDTLDPTKMFIFQKVEFKN